MSLPVVPNAFGFGMDTRAAYGGGTDPTVYRVTNLNDGGSNSLREALEASGPRVVIFEISGTIALSADINIIAPYLTVAGQTSPSPGITLKGGALNVYGHDVLLQHLRIRVGDGGPILPQTADHDASIAYSTAYNVVYDHCSMSWAGGKNQELISLPSGAMITMWRCISSEALYHAANVIVDPGQPSSLGLLLSANYTNQPVYLSILQNLLAHNSDRNPEMQGPVNVHFINNVVYDWGTDATAYPWASFFYSADGTIMGGKLDIISNVYIGGTVATPFPPLYAIGVWGGNATPLELYKSDNVLDSTVQSVTEYFNNAGYDPLVGTPPVSLTGITVMAGSTVKTSILTNAGARPVDRDAVDNRIVADVLNYTGTVISSQAQVGGWPTLAVNTRALTLPANPNVDSGNGYTNLEVWLQAYATAVEGGGPPPPPGPSAGMLLMFPQGLG